MLRWGGGGGVSCFPQIDGPELTDLAYCTYAACDYISVLFGSCSRVAYVPRPRREWGLGMSLAMHSPRRVGRGLPCCLEPQTTMHHSERELTDTRALFVFAIELIVITVTYI